MHRMKRQTSGFPFILQSFNSSCHSFFLDVFRFLSSADVRHKHAAKTQLGTAVKRHGFVSEAVYGPIQTLSFHTQEGRKQEKVRGGGVFMFRVTLLTRMNRPKGYTLTIYFTSNMEIIQKTLLRPRIPAHAA